MHKVQLTDRTKLDKIAVYYMEDAKQLYEHWKATEESEQRVEKMRRALKGEPESDLGLTYEEAPFIMESDVKVGAKQDFTLEKNWIVLHNTKGYESRYYVENLLVKIRYAVENGVYLKLGSFVAKGITKENAYAEGGFEQVLCCGNPVLYHYSSYIVPQVSEFEEDFSQEQITMLGYKILAVYASMEEVNEEIAKKELTVEEVEVLLHDIPGELG